MPPPYMATVTTNHYDLPALAPNTLYYWKIVVVGSCGRTHGSVWRFTTQEAAPAPTPNPTPTGEPLWTHRLCLPMVLK
jgi:hypothetical protein